MKDAKTITMKIGKPATQRTCPTCGTRMFRIGKSQVFASNDLDIRIDRAGYTRYRDVQPIYFTNHTYQTKVTQEQGSGSISKK